MITKKYYKLIRVSYADEGYFCLTNVGNSIGTVKIDKKQGHHSADNITYEYSTDGVNWTTYNTVGVEVSVDPNSNIYWRHTGSDNSYVIGNNNQFYFDFDCVASGNLMSLYSENFISYTGNWKASGLFMSQTHLLRADFNIGSTTSINEYHNMGRIFFGCTNLTSVPDLSNIISVEGVINNPETGLGSAFYQCTSLTTVPDLSNVTTVGDRGMDQMFRECTSLTTVPDLSSVTTVGDLGMSQMFYDCTSLTSSPNLSNVTTVGDGGMDQMFYNCTSLTSSPNLSSVTTVGNNGMNQMFYNCTSLTSSPDLSSVTTVGDSGMDQMFRECTSLTTGPNISNVTTAGSQAFAAMFLICNHLTTAYAPTITWDTNKMSDWLNIVAASGTLYADSSIASSIPTSNNSGCPSGWTVVTL